MVPVHTPEAETQRSFAPQELVNTLRCSFNTGVTRPISWRKQQLSQLLTMINDHEKEILEAIYTDLRKGEADGYTTETGAVANEIRHALRNIDRWTKPTRVGVPLAAQPGRAAVHYQPAGVVLIIGPWNYPFSLVLSPLVAAISAGNAAIIKPSELTPATSAITAQLIEKYLPNDIFRVVEGGVAESTALLRQQFDHIFFTGGTAVGKIVMRAAAEHLTPVTLELGGKSPTYVDREVNLDLAARRIVWGRYLNCGQTCVAPDYILAHEEIIAPLIERMKHYVVQFFGEDPQQSEDYPRIVNERHFDRLVGLLEHQQPVIGGNYDRSDLYMAPTILTGVDPESPVMQEEIFGPILPVLPIRGTSEAIQFINQRPNPLALYVFSSLRETHQQFIEETASGDVLINDVLVHYIVPGIPFGGKGASGMGAYHGHHGFVTFSHAKGVLHRSTLGDVPFRYPPFTQRKLSWLRRLV